MFGFWTAVLTVGIFYRIARTIASTMRKRRPELNPTLKHGPWSKLRLGTKYYLSTPALWSQRAAEPVGWCTVPPRLQSLTIVAFAVINVVLSCVNYTLFANDP